MYNLSHVEEIYQISIYLNISIILLFIQVNKAASMNRAAIDREELLNTQFTTNASNRDSETAILINK